MRAILIDPYARTVTEVEHDGTLEAMYATIPCDLVEAVRISEHDTLWIDEEGFLSPGRPVYRMGENPQGLAGRGLIFGFTGSGDTVATKISLALVTANVHWTDLESSGDFYPGGVAEGGDGEQFDFIIRGGAPVLRKRQ
jgi:hypothetical protein